MICFHFKHIQTDLLSIIKIKVNKYKPSLQQTNYDGKFMWALYQKLRLYGFFYCYGERVKNFNRYDLKMKMIDFVVNSYEFIPGHVPSTQVVVSWFTPRHCSPPSCGAGLSHDRVLDRVPLPQDRSQLDQDCQLDHDPSTTVNTETITRTHLIIQIHNLFEYIKLN